MKLEESRESKSIRQDFQNSSEKSSLSLIRTNRRKMPPLRMHYLVDDYKEFMDQKQGNHS